MGPSIMEIDNGERIKLINVLAIARENVKSLSLTYSEDEKIMKMMVDQFNDLSDWLKFLAHEGKKGGVDGRSDN